MNDEGPIKKKKNKEKDHMKERWDASTWSTSQMGHQQHHASKLPH